MDGTSNFEVEEIKIVITSAANHSCMANSNRVRNLEENQKLDEDLALRLAKIIEVLQNIED
jgi:hypothetical protein